MDDRMSEKPFYYNAQSAVALDCRNILLLLIASAPGKMLTLPKDAPCRLQIPYLRRLLVLAFPTAPEK
jgi:hypothetical protein